MYAEGRKEGQVNGIVAVISAIFEPLFNLVSQVVDKFGTKFAIAICSIAGLLYLAIQPSIAPPPISYILPIACVLGIVAVAIFYFVYRKKQETEQIDLAKTQTPNKES